MRRLAGLKELTGQYDALLCDVWGVIHNGVAAYPEAIEALRRFRAEAGPVVLLTNAPRPHGPIREQLRQLRVPDDAYDAIVTSGDVTRSVLAERPGVKVLHIGPDRDLSFYEGLDVRLVGEAEAEMVSCTAPVDDEIETAEDYRALLERLAARALVMVCANPDLVVERGGKLITCAGALAALYKELGGKAILVGKPHAPIYDAARRMTAALGGSRVLAVGDGLPTDISGACGNGFDALFVTGGIHAADFGPARAPEPDRVAARLKAEGLSAVAFMAALAWNGGAHDGDPRRSIANARLQAVNAKQPEVRVGPGDLPASWRGGVVAIGNFDGVHRGHQAVLSAARAEAERRNVACLMLTFEPHPRAFFAGRPLFRLTPLPLKGAVAAALGFDGTLVLTFDRSLADESAEDFVRLMLVERLAIQAAVTGYDFHFGKARRGTPGFLAAEGRRHGFAVMVVDALEEGAEPVSSTRIRAALAKGDVASANALLGWSFAVAGDIIRGEARGRELGYPTANMALDPATELAHGIYAVRYRRPDGSLHDGVASFGRRPTFGEGAPLFETFLFNFSGDLYGETALVALVGFIRPEEKFASTEALVARMEQDSVSARTLLERVAASPLDARIGEAWAETSKSWLVG